METPKGKRYRYDYIRLPSDKVLHCEVFDCKHGVYPKSICCRECPVYALCEDHCLNHPDRCNVWTDVKKRRDREAIIRSLIGKSDVVTQLAQESEDDV